jgi:hypothetical protein
LARRVLAALHIPPHGQLFIDCFQDVDKEIISGRFDMTAFVYGNCSFPFLYVTLTLIISEEILHLILHTVLYECERAPTSLHVLHFKY